MHRSASSSSFLLRISRQLREHASKHHNRYYHTSKNEKLRVAIVGGGCAAWSVALHLSELVRVGKLAGPIDMYTGGGGGGPSSSATSSSNPNSSTSVGVGIWSTAIAPLSPTRTSHVLVKDCLNFHGTYLKDVGYRTMDGSWLCRSVLRDPTTLLFLRESDLLQSLQKGVHLEEQSNTIRTFPDTVTGLWEESTHPHSTNVWLQCSDTPKLSERDYHLIIAADGMHSILRSTYGGYELSRTRLTGTAALQNSDLDSFRKEAQHTEHIGIQDRNYTVFRGNCPRSRRDLHQQGDISFQTWGEEKSMRFASVPMNVLKGANQKQEHQVWFATIDEDDITKEPDDTIRRDKLLQGFADWHDPIPQIIQSTPAEAIVHQRAMAHKHTMGPILNFHSVVETIRGRRPPSSGEGPCIVFVGDALMAVDPILAQGFTCAMEGAADLRWCVERAVQPSSLDPMRLREEIKQRHVQQVERIICLLRSTELVQALGQPKSRLSGFFQKHVLRPVVKRIPNFVKAPIFDAVLRYSLGLGLFRKSQQKA